MIDLPLLQTVRYQPEEHAYVNSTEIESVHEELTREGIGLGYRNVCRVTMKTGQVFTTTESGQLIRSQIEHEEIERAEILRFLPGDVLVVTMRDNPVGREEVAMSIRAAWQRMLPSWVKVIVTSGCDLKVVRPADGGAETEANGAEGIAGEPGQTGSE